MHPPKQGSNSRKDNRTQSRGQGKCREFSKGRINEKPPAAVCHPLSGRQGSDAAALQRQFRLICFLNDEPAVIGDSLVKQVTLRTGTLRVGVKQGDATVTGQGQRWQNKGTGAGTCGQQKPSFQFQNWPPQPHHETQPSVHTKLSLWVL